MSGFREENIRVRIQAISDLPEVGDQLTELTRLTKQLIEATQQSALSARTNSLQQISAIDGVTSALKEQQGAAKKAGDEQADNLKKVSNEYEGLGKSVRNFTSLVASAFTLNEIKNFGLEIVDAKTKIDSLKIGLETMLGSKKLTNELYADMVKLAKQTPFSLEEIGEQVSKLSAYNVSTQELIPTITALGNIAAAVGKDKLPQLTLAYGQVRNAGVLMGTELRQFTEAGVPLLDLIAKAYDKTKDAVVKMAADHEISFDMVRKALMDASAEGGKYANLMEKVSKTVGGEVSNLGDTFFVAKARIGDFFETQIRSGTRNLNDLIDALAGSDAAIKRTVSSVAAAVSAWIAARTALNLLSAQKLIDEGQTDRLTLSQRILTVSTESMAAATATATGGIRALFVAMASNPLGAIITLVSLAASAWMTYDAAVQDTTQTMTEQGNQLRSEQAELNGLAKAAMAAGVGTLDRKEAIEALISKYPEYFSGLTAEKTSNSQLKSILDSVNKSYQDRIALAREAYKMEGFKEKQNELFGLEEELFARVKKANILNEELVLSFGGSAEKLLAYLKTHAKESVALSSQWTGFYADNIEKMAGKIVGQQKEIEYSVNQSNVRISNLNDGAAKTALAAEEAHHKAVLEQNAGNNKAIEAENVRYKKALADLTKTSNENEIKTITDHAEKTKQVILISDKEIALIKKQGEADQEVDRIKQLKAQFDYLNAQEDAELASVKKRIVNKNISNAQLATLQEQARREAIAIDQKYDLERAKVLEQIEQEEARRFLARMQEQQDKIQVLTVKRLEAERMLTTLNDAKTNEERLAALKVYHEKYNDNLNQQLVLELQKQRDNSKKILDEIIARNGERGEEYRKAYAQWLKDDEQYNTALTKQAVDAAKETAKAIEGYEKDIQEAHKRTTEIEKDALEKSKQNRREFLNGLASLLGQGSGFFSQITSGLVSLYNEFDNLNLKALSSAQGLLKNANETLSGIQMIYSDGSAEGAAKIAQAQESVANAKKGVAEAQSTSLAAGIAIMGTVYQVLSAIADAFNQAESARWQAVASAMQKTRQAYQQMYSDLGKLNEEAYRNELATFNGTYDEKLARINAYYAQEKAYAEGRDRLEAQFYYAQKTAEIQAYIYTDFKRSVEAMADLRKFQREQEFNERIQAAELEKKQLADQLAANIANIDAQLNKFKEAKQAEIDAEQKALDERKRLNEQFSSDRQLRLQEDAVFRQQLLDQGEAREVAALKAAKQRELQRAAESNASAEEVARINIAFDKLIADKHAEYATARGQKEKEISLANQEAKAQEKDKVNALESASAQTISGLQAQIRNQEVKAAADKALANTQYANDVLRANREIFRAQRDMLVAQLQAEIAVLNSKKSWTGIGNGKINDAINEINGAVARLSGMDVYVNDLIPGVNVTQQDLNEWLKSLPNVGNQARRLDNGEAIVAARDQKGNAVIINYNEKAGRKTVYDDQRRPFEIIFGDVWNPTTGERYATGTEYVEGKGRPNGVDTVPAWLTKGERVMTTDQNRMLGKISNEELVEKISYFDKLAAQYPQLLNPVMWSEMAHTTMTLPKGVINSTGGSTISLAELQGLRSDMRQILGEMRDAVGNQQRLSISMDEAGFTKSISKAMSKQTYYTNLLNQ